MIGIDAVAGQADAAAPRSARDRDGDVAVERAHWLALAALPGVGPATFARVVRRYGGATAAWVAAGDWIPELPRHPHESLEAYRRTRRAGVDRTVQRIEERLAAVGARAVTADEDDYPSVLRSLEPHPPVLYVRGVLLPLEAPTVAVVGTRRASGYGRTVAAEIADELARAGATVVSGLALGVDGEAHAAAIGAGGASVAVLPSPVDRVYPPRHAGLAERLVAQGGAVLSEVPPGTQVGKPDFARRNRIIAGLAIAVVVVEAPDHSGALLTAAAATQLGREVYAVPGPIHAAASRGCNRLIADHDATLVTSAVGLLHQIGVSRGRSPVSVSALSEVEGLVLAQLLERPASIEELIDRTRHGTSALASALTLLEARGLVTTYGGATFFATLAARRIGGGHRARPPGQPTT